MLTTLWRRAPAWRLTLFAAVSFTLLAALFPRVRPAAVATDPPASFALPSDRVPTALGGVATPPLGPGREGVIPYAGRQLSLPPGKWQVLSLGRDESAQPKQMTILAAWRGTQLGGVLVVLAPDALSQPTGLPLAPQACSAPNVLAAETAPPPANSDPYVHECWTLTSESLRSGPEANGTMQRDLARLAEMSVAVPDRLLALRYIRSTDYGWFLGILYLPPRAGTPIRADRAVVAWARHYAALLHRGYDGELAAGASVPGLPKDYD